jgi:hypothetical protein
MARYVPGALVSSVSGCVGGVEFSSGKSGGVVKSRRRNRGVNTERWVASCCTAQWFASLWAQASEQLRQQWKSLAASKPTVNRFRQSVTLTGYQAALQWHSCLYDALNRVTGGASALQVPPPASLVPGYIWTASASFTEGGQYLLNNHITIKGYTVEILYAQRGRYQRYTGSTNMRFIGAKRKWQDEVDWADDFKKAGCDWDFQAGEWIGLEWYHMYFDFVAWGYSWPNYTARWLVQVGAP